MSDTSSLLRVAFVYPGGSARGVATVSESAAVGVAAWGDVQVSLVAVHDPPAIPATRSQCSVYELRLPLEAREASCGFHRWLQENPQDVLVMNDVSLLEPYWPHIPTDTALVTVIHDDGYRYLRPIIEHQAAIDGVVTVSKFVQQYVRRKLPRYGGILTTIYNGCEFGAPPRRPEKSEQVLRILFVGSGDLFKGVSDLPHMMKSIRERGIAARISIVGLTDEQLRADFDRLCPKVDVRWYGRQTHDECLQLATEHDVILIPSRSESFGMVTVEAMAMGCVPIAYDIESGSREIVESGHSGFLVSFADYDAVAEVAARLHESPDEWFRISSNAIARARKSFSVDQMAAGYSSLFARLRTLRLKRTPQRLAFEGTVRTRRQSLYQMLPQSMRLWIRHWLSNRPGLVRAARRWRF